MKKRIAAIALSLIVAAVFTLPQGTVFAATKAEKLDQRAVMGSSMTEEESGYSLMSGGKAWAKTSAGRFNNGRGSKALTGAIQKGVDISKHNGKINWAKVAKSDIDYVIIRCGYGSNKKSYDDKRWEYNVSQCEKYGIPYGVYIYSYANSTSRVKSEIAHTKRLLKGHHPQYPVYYDLEDRIVRNKGKTFITNAALRFCSEISSAGYTSGVYASRSWWNSYMTSSKLDKYEKWIAEWNSTGTIYKKAYGMWQCSSSYHTSGISGRVDLDFSYKQYGGNTPGAWAEDAGGRTIFKTFRAKSGGRYDTAASLTAKEKFITRVGKTYYMDADGHKLTGFNTIGKWKYRFSSNAGIMRKSEFFTVSGKTYYSNADGHMILNKYRKVGNYYYGFSEKGVRLTGNAVIGDKCYRFLSNGMACLNQSQLKTKAAYKRSPGTKYKNVGTLAKGKKVYVIRVLGSWSRLSNGYWIMTKYLKKVKTYPYAKPEEAPVDPTEPTDPTDPSGGEDPGEGTDPSDQTDPGEGTDPSDQTDPAGGEDPGDETDPIDPGQQTEQTGESN